MRFTVTKVLIVVFAVLLGGYAFVVAPHLAWEQERERRAAIDAVLPPSVAIPSATGPARPGPVFPARGDAFVGIMTGEGLDDFAEAADFTRRTRHRPQVYQFAQDWAHDRFDAERLDQVARRGMMPMVAWEPWDHTEEAEEPELRGEQPDFRLSRIVEGAFDSYIRSWAEGIASLGYPVGIRFAHEMNGYWYPWCEQSNDNRPGEYKKAWRHVHDLFDEAGATNAVWVWSPNVDYANATPFKALYPGDAYVDWVGLSGYYGTVGKENYQSFERLFSPSKAKLRRLTDKPLVITELGATDAAGRKAEWIAEMFRTLPRHRDIIGIIWFQAVKEIDWRVTSSEAGLRAFAAGVANARYRTAWTPGSVPRGTG